MGALFEQLSQRLDSTDQAVAADLNYGPIERSPAVQCGRRTDHAVTSDHRGLNHFARGEGDHERHDGIRRKIDRVYRISDIEKDLLLCELGWLQMNLQRAALVVG